LLDLAATHTAPPSGAPRPSHAAPAMHAARQPDSASSPPATPPGSPPAVTPIRPPLHPLGRLRLDRTPLGRLPPRCHQRQLAPFPPTLLSHIFQSMCIVHLLPPTRISWSLAPNTVSFSP
jgi:hypothetical protein